MAERLNNMEVKRRNRRSIMARLLKLETATKPELARDLNYSLPTVNALCDELVAEDLVEVVGMQASGGGRRAVQYRVRTDMHLAAGMDITSRYVCLAVVDIRGRMVASECFEFPFEDSAAYLEKLSVRYQMFLREGDIDPEKILGLGVSVPGVMAEKQDSLVFSHVLQVGKDSVVNRLQTHGGFPDRICYFNDAKAACMAECYSGNSPESFIYLNLSNSVGGAMVIGNQIVSGDQGRCGEFGHVMIVPDGRPCYCGKLGHYDPYGSALVLADKAGGSLKAFFSQLETGDRETEAAFSEYLHYLAIMLCNLRMASDLPIIIGGYMGRYLRAYIARLWEETRKLTIFDEEESFILPCHFNTEAPAVGAASHFIQQFLINI